MQDQIAIMGMTTAAELYNWAAQHGFTKDGRLFNEFKKALLDMGISYDDMRNAKASGQMQDISNLISLGYKLDLDQLAVMLKYNAPDLIFKSWRAPTMGPRAMRIYISKPAGTTWPNAVTTADIKVYVYFENGQARLSVFVQERTMGSAWCRNMANRITELLDKEYKILHYCQQHSALADQSQDPDLPTYASAADVEMIRLQLQQDPLPIIPNPYYNDAFTPITHVAALSGTWNAFYHGPGKVVAYVKDAMVLAFMYTEVNHANIKEMMPAGTVAYFVKAIKNSAIGFDKYTIL